MNKCSLQGLVRAPRRVTLRPTQLAQNCPCIRLRGSIDRQQSPVARSLPPRDKKDSSDPVSLDDTATPKTSLITSVLKLGPRKLAILSLVLAIFLAAISRFLLIALVGIERTVVGGLVLTENVIISLGTGFGRGALLAIGVGITYYLVSELAKDDSDITSGGDSDESKGPKKRS